MGSVFHAHSLIS